MTILDQRRAVYRCTTCGACLMRSEVMDNWQHQIIPENDLWNYCGPVRIEWANGGLSATDPRTTKET